MIKRSSACTNGNYFSEICDIIFNGLLYAKEGFQLNIAIVDDMAHEREALCHLLKKYEVESNQKVDIEEYESGMSFLSSYIPEKYDIVFMDIFLNDENGVDCALSLRQLDRNVNLIFLTTSSEFGVKSYDVRAADYIIKPPTTEKISRALKYCKTEKSQKKPSITVTINHSPLKILTERILYADYQNRSACIHLRDCTISASGSLSELSDKLTAHTQFMSCFKGIVVNLAEVRELGNDYLILKNGERLPVSRRLHRQVQQKRLSLSAGSLRGGVL